MSNTKPPFGEKISDRQVGYILRSYPRLSQTFIVNEMAVLEQLGVNIQIFAITNPHESIVQSQVNDIQAQVYYLESAQKQSPAAILTEHLQLALTSPWRYFKTLGYVIQHREFDTGYTASSRYQCFLQAVHLAQRIKRQRKHNKEAINHLHAHFAHDPTLIALLVHKLIGIPYSFTAHARDLYQIHKSALIERIEQATTVVTCCENNVNYINKIVPKSLGEKVKLVYHGVNLQEFQPREASHKERSSEEAHLILSVGRLVEKKGFPDLLHACHHLKGAGYHFRCIIYGSGPLHQELLTTIEELGLEDSVVLAGQCSQLELQAILGQADVFALTPFVTENGDRDGVPNVLVEAMACGLPVVSTAVAGIPELIIHNHNGLLAQPRDVKGIAEALATILDDKAKQKQMGKMARHTVFEHFDLHMNAYQIAKIFDNLVKVVDLRSEAYREGV